MDNLELSIETVVLVIVAVIILIAAMYALFPAALDISNIDYKNSIPGLSDFIRVAEG